MTTNQCQSKKNLRSKDLLCLRLLANCYYRVLVCTVFLYLCCIWYPWLCIFVASTSVRDQMAWRPTRVRATERGESECEQGWKGFEKATLQYSAWCWTRKRNKCIQTARSKLQAMEYSGGSIQGREGGWKWIWEVIWAKALLQKWTLQPVWVFMGSGEVLVGGVGCNQKDLQK